MNMTFDVLVIVLSCLLGIFLILASTVVVFVLRLVKSLRQIVAKGEQFVDSAEAITDTLKRNAGTVQLLKILMRFVSKLK